MTRNIGELKAPRTTIVIGADVRDEPEKRKDEDQGHKTHTHLIRSALFGTCKSPPDPSTLKCLILRPFVRFGVRIADEGC